MCPAVFLRVCLNFICPLACLSQYLLPFSHFFHSKFLWGTEVRLGLCALHSFMFKTVRVHDQDNLPCSHHWSSLNTFLAPSLYPQLQPPQPLYSSLSWSRPLDLPFPYLSTSNIHLACVSVASDCCSNVPLSIKAATTKKFTFKFCHHKCPMSLTLFIFSYPLTFSLVFLFNMYYYFKSFYNLLFLLVLSEVYL